MSFYATISGYLTYSTHDHLDSVIDCLTRGGWLNGNEQWRRDGTPVHTRSDSTIDHDRNLLVIPPSQYRNLARITTDLFAGATAGLVVTSSTDNCFDAWMEQPLPEAAALQPGEGGDVSSIQCIDLEKFAQIRGLGVKRPDDPGHFAWREDVRTAFHEEYDPDVFQILDSPHTPLE